MIYADYNGSAPLDHNVAKYLQSRISEGPFANPNAIHHLGQKTMIAMERARGLCSKMIGAHPSQMFFNSGSTEGISQVFKSLCDKKSSKDIIVISGIEHSAVVNNASYYQEKYGYEVRTLPILENGLIDKETLMNWLSVDGTRISIVAIMAANNETGVVQPFKDIAKACTEFGVPYMCDTTQLIGKGDFNFEESGVDYAFLSGHKIGALGGTGILFAKDPSTLEALVIGGSQEKSLRGGTQNYLGYETIAVALSSFHEDMDKLPELKAKREEFETKLKEKYSDLVIFGQDAPRLAGTSFISMPGIHGQAIQIELESQGIYVTTSSACSDNEPTTSKVLRAMNVQDDAGRGAVRISLGLCSPLSSYDKLFEALDKAFTKLKKIKSF